MATPFQRNFALTSHLVVGGLIVLARWRFGPVARVLAYVLGALCVPFLGILLLLVLPWSVDLLSRRDFDSAVWQAPERSEPVRIRMVDGLLDEYELDGLTRTELEALLGPADDTTYFSEWDYVYWLGPERGLFSIDSEWLVLRLGEDDRVSEHRLVTD